MSPELISSSPAIMRSVVDFPQPDGPTRTMNSLSLIWRLTSRTATTSSNRFTRSFRTTCAIERSSGVGELPWLGRRSTRGADNRCWLRTRLPEDGSHHRGGGGPLSRGPPPAAGRLPAGAIRDVGHVVDSRHPRAGAGRDEREASPARSPRGPRPGAARRQRGRAPRWRDRPGSGELRVDALDLLLPPLHRRLQVQLVGAELGEGIDHHEL